MNEMLPIIERLDELKKLIENKNPDKWLSLREIARYSGLSESTIRRLVSSGRLRVSKKLGKLMFRRSWIDRFLNG